MEDEEHHRIMRPNMNVSSPPTVEFFPCSPSEISGFPSSSPLLIVSNVFFILTHLIKLKHAVPINQSLLLTVTDTELKHISAYSNIILNK